MEEEKKGGKRLDKKIEDLLIEVTEENIAKYTINDVVMPIVGYSTRYPKNEELKALILGIMKEDNITPETFEG